MRTHRRSNSSPARAASAKTLFVALKKTVETLLAKPWRRAVVGSFILTAIVFVVYSPSIQGDFLLDDDNLLWENQLIRSSDGLSRLWFTKESPDYWPVSNSTLWLEWRAWEKNPLGYHVTNDLLHVAACLLLWLILRQLCIPGAYLAALLFAVHPVNVESIAWIAQRKDALAIVFFLLSVACFLRAEMRPGRAALSGRGPASCKAAWWRKVGDGLMSAKLRYYPPGTLRWHLLSLLMFVAAVLSKGSAVILPLALVIVLCWRRRPTWHDCVRLAPFFAAAGAMTWVNIWFQTHGGPAIREFHAIDRPLQAGAVTWFYLYKAILPFDLSFVYPLWKIERWNALWWLPFLAAIGFTVVLWGLSRKRRRLGRPLFFAWLFFLAGLFPVMGWTDIAYMRFSLVADHYQHIALLAIVTLAAVGAYFWYERARGYQRMAAIAATLAVVAVFSIVSYRQNGLYVNAETLYKAAIAKNHDCAVLYNELGRIHTRACRFPDAINEFELAIKAKPDYAEAYNNMGATLAQVGRNEESVACLHRAAGLNEGYDIARLNLAITYKNMGRLPEAAEQLSRVVKGNPRRFDIRCRLCETLLALGKTDEAIAALKEVRTSGQDVAANECAIGLALFQLNRHADAADCFRRAIALDKNHTDSHFYLGTIHRREGRPAEALKEFEETVRCNAEAIKAYTNIAEIEVAAGRLDEGLVQAKKAVDIARASAEKNGNKNGEKQAAAELELWIESLQRRK
ncbi:MAG: tetratricopeptide repeat protein [Planctomycetaceae bacterium]|nr:tetratricopeptide repeat protein [Planctomycetaceae bacterium]